MSEASVIIDGKTGRVAAESKTITDESSPFRGGSNSKEPQARSARNGDEAAYGRSEVKETRRIACRKKIISTA